MNKSTLTAIACGVSGALVGSLTTYFVVRRKFEEQASRDIEEVKRHYALLRKDPAVVSTQFGNLVEPGEARSEAKRIADAIINRQGYFAPEDDPRPSARTIVDGDTRNVFEDGPPEGWEEPGEDDLTDQEPTVAEDQEPYEVIPGEPYLISSSDFFNTEDDYAKISMTYYEGDDTLADDRERHVDDVERAVGYRHLSMFGRPNEAPSLVFVRNEAMETDFEITLDKGEYAVRVLGLEKEVLGLREPKQRPKRMRDDD